MKVVVENRFKKSIKKLHKNQKADLDDAIIEILENPSIGLEKAGNLSGIRVHKFKMVKQLTLLAYEYDGLDTITLLSLGSHENFYRDLKH